MQLLFAEDDKRLSHLVIRMLKEEKYSVDWVEDGITAFDYAAAGHYDVVVLDWMLPKLDGIEVCRQLREQQYQGAILMLTARMTVEDRVAGLDAGADDYLTKPFEFDELFARLRALIRRKQRDYQEETLAVADLSIDTQNAMVYRGEQWIPLTPREYQLLLLLARNEGQVMSRELILERVWGMDHEVTGNTLEAYIKLIRKKLDPQGKKDYIQTVRGIGYRLEGTKK
ncbi:MAG TPA: response regulator transcription factor [Bacillales bacterium]|nr:response regulator transcription factor [Bacillales bacterium]